VRLFVHSFSAPSYGRTFTTTGVYDIIAIIWRAIADKTPQGRITMTDINDLVLIYLEDQPQAFARIEAIEPDAKRGWYHVKLLLLQIPLMVVTWILRDAYINGESFTMEGKAMRLERVASPDALEKPSEKTDSDVGGKKGKVISLTDLKKK
jgi:hypothetical protein